MRAQLSDVERKNGWQMAERLGDSTPDGVQHLLARALWDADAVRDELLRYVGEALGAADAVLIVDETGFLKKGDQFAVRSGLRQVRAKQLPAGVPAHGWRRLSCGEGAKGPRQYDWALLPANAPEPERYARCLLLRRSMSDPADVAYFACGGPPATTLEDLVRIGGPAPGDRGMF